MQETQDGGDRAQAPPKAPASTPLRNLALLIGSLLLSLILVEIGFRLAVGRPVASLTNWRTAEVVYSRYGERSASDPVLGWTNLPWVDADGFATIDYGVRRNFGETAVRTGAVLAVGDSFTEGWDVGNPETWPAALEGLTGVPVVNAGMGGYGTDQIVLRAEQLLPLVKPSVLIIGFLEDDIWRAAYSSWGTPKPYFTVANGALVFHPPEPLEAKGTESLRATVGFALRDALGYSAAADHVLARLAPDYWYSSRSEPYRHRDEVDEVAVTCALVKQLKAQADREGIRTALFMQYTAQGILMTGRRTREAERVIACAQEAGVRVVDQFPALYAVAAGNRAAMRDYYVLVAGNYGHMSAHGNREAAELLAAELADWLEELPGTHSVAPQADPVQGPVRRVIRARVGGPVRSCTSAQC